MDVTASLLGILYEISGILDFDTIDLVFFFYEKPLLICWQSLET